MKKFILCAILITLLVGCSASVRVKNKSTDKPHWWIEASLPPNAYNVEVIDETWTYFSFDGRKYLWWNDGNQAGLTYIGEDEEN